MEKHPSHATPPPSENFDDRPAYVHQLGEVHLGKLESRQEGGFLVDIEAAIHGYLPCSIALLASLAQWEIHEVRVIGEGPIMGFETRGPILELVDIPPRASRSALGKAGP